MLWYGIISFKLRFICTSSGNLKHRLSLVAADIETLLRTASASARARAAIAVSELALHRCGVPTPPDLVRPNAREAYAAALDAEYLKLSDEGHTSCDSAFSAARAASSAAFASSEKCEDAVYEAIIATDDAEAVRRLVIASLRP